MANNYQHARGALVAEVLSGAWLESPPADDLSPDKVAGVSSLLYSSGSAALGWWRVSRVQSPTSKVQSHIRTGSRSDRVGRLQNPTSNVENHLAANRHWTSDIGHWTFLHDAYRQARLAALVHEQEIKHVLSLLRAVDIEPVLVKGWAIARLYPDRALRPYGDIDLCVRPDQFEKAAAALKCLESIAGHYVDLHAGFGNIGVDTANSWNHYSARSPRPQRLSGEQRRLRIHRRDAERAEASQRKGDWEDLFQRSQLVPLGDEEVRVLCDEDHLRLLCLHLLRSGAWRPLWLCDVALLLEKIQSTGFDWDVCLGSNPLYADWVAVTVGLAHQLLGVEVKDTPVAERAKHLPRWLVPAVLKQWGREHYAAPVKSSVSKSETEDGRPTTENTEFDLPRSSVGGHRSFLDIGHWTNLYRRWDNPVRATAAVHGQFNNWPRLPYRLRESVMRSRELPKALASIFRESGSRQRTPPVLVPMRRSS